MITFCSYRISLWENSRPKSNNFTCCTFGWPQLECFRKTFEPSANVEGLGIPFAICDSCLPNKAAFSILRKHDDRQKTRQWWKRLFHSLHTGCFSCCEKEKEILLKIFTLTTKFFSKAFHQCEKWLNKHSCWKTKFPCLIFFNELRASSLQFKRFIQTSLRHSFSG